MTTMDAQEITFNQDPESRATDIEENSKESGCCCKVVCCPCKVFYWYIAPLTCELCYTFKCMLFHPINFAFSVFLFSFDVSMISTGIGLIPVCCTGLPLLWIALELIVAFSRIDLGLHYYMVESAKTLKKSRNHLLTLSLYHTNIPLCFCYNHEYDSCMTLMLERMKGLFTSIEVYKYMLYHIFIRFVITCSTWWIVIVVCVNIGLVGVPVWYLVNDSVFVNNQIVFGWSKDCKWVKLDGNDYDSVVCDQDWSFIINTFSRAFGVGIVSLLVLPIIMRINNTFACLNKVVSYKFYTLYYSKNANKDQAQAPILNNCARVNSV